MQLLAMCSRVYEWFSVYSYYEAIKREVLECKHAPKDILRFFFFGIKPSIWGMFVFHTILSNCPF